MKALKTFKDLKFNKKPWSTEEYGIGYYAELTFDNGYGISVIYGAGAYCNNVVLDKFELQSGKKPATKQTYECAVTHSGNLCYNTHIAEDVITYQTSSQITEVMKQIQNLPKEISNEHTQDRPEQD